MNLTCEGDVAVCLVTHNGERYIEEQLRSILAQSRKACCIYLVDDGSKDHTLDLAVRAVESVQDRPRLRILSPPHPPSSDLHTRIAQNFSVAFDAASSHRHVMFSDQDDRWLPNRVEMQTLALEASMALVTVGDAVLIDAAGTRLQRSIRDTFPIPSNWGLLSPTEQWHVVLASPVATGAAMAVRGDFARLALPVPSGWLHDRWFSILAAYAGRLDIAPEAVIEYRIHDQQVVGSSLGPSGMNRALQFGREARKLASVLRRLKNVRNGGTDVVEGLSSIGIGLQLLRAKWNV